MLFQVFCSTFSPEEELLTAVREVSEDYIYDTLEFNEFLQMMAKQQNNVYTRDDVKAAFRIFDDDDDGCIHAQDLVEVKNSSCPISVYFESNLMIPI